MVRQETCSSIKIKLKKHWLPNLKIITPLFRKCWLKQLFPKSALTELVFRNLRYMFV